MIDYEVLFIDGSATAKYTALSKAAASFSVNADTIKLMERQDEEERKLNSYITRIQDGAALVNISGVLVNDDSWYNKYIGAISYEEINRALVDILSNDVNAVMFNFDTPGGEGGRMIDIAEMISNLDIPTVSHTSTSMSSAGYFTGCQADYVYANDFASVGSVGVYIKVGDYTEMYKQIGIKFERFRSGELKASGDPAFTLTKKEKEHITEKCASLATKFYNVVSQARGIPMELLMQSEIPTGRTFTGREAISNYLIDGVQSLERSWLKTLQLAAEKVDNQPVYGLR